jgi:TonB family protein
MMAMAHALSAALLDFVWQGLLAAFLLWTALFVLKNRAPRARYLASCVALAVMAILPVATACLVYTAPAVSHAAAEWSGAVPETMRATLPGPAGSGFEWAADWVNRVARLALPVWSFGVLLFSLRLVWASRQISFLRRRAEPAEAALLASVACLRERMRLARPVRVLISAVTDCPSVVGWMRPVLLLPASTVLGLTPQQLEAVLAHEIAHILRYDYLVNMLQTVVETLLFYHPAVWWASARIRHERELCCDDLAVESCGDALGYARALTRLERLRATTPALALGSTGGPLLYRIQRLAGDAGWQRGPSKLPGILALSLGLVCFALNMPWARGQQQEASVPRPETVERAMPDEPGVTIDLGDANLIHRDEVEYPEAAIQKGVQGTVVVEATLDAAGVVSDARVLSGPQELRKAALQSVLQWHFAHGEAGSTRRIGIAFQLPSAGDTTRHSADQRARQAAVRALAEEQASAQALAQKQLAEIMAEKARDLAGQQKADASERQLAARKLAELAQQAELDRVLRSDDLAKVYAERDREFTSTAIESLESQLRKQEVLLEQEREMADLKSHPLEAGPNGFYFPDPVSVGRRLKTIDIRGLSAASRDELLAKLPVRVGDILADDSLARIKAAVKQFDEHLRVMIFSPRDGQVEIHIAAPGSGDRFEPPE